MQTQTKTRSETLNANLMSLPLMKNFDTTQIATKVDNFRKGEFTLFTALKIAVMGGLGYLVWTYVLPPIFLAIGSSLAAVATGVIVVGAILAAPAIFKWLRVFARFLHKNAIKFDPFAQLETERQKLLVNQATFRVSKGGISKLRDDMAAESKNSEKEVEDGKTTIIRIQGKAEKIKSEMDDMVKKGGVAAKSEDEYVNRASDLQKILAESQRIVNKLNQSKDFVQKYGTRAAIMKKLGQKLVGVETNMEIKIADFDATVEMLKKDYEFGQKANQATTAAKSAMLFSKGWEFDYAMEVVTSTISADIAITSGNLKDIDTMTAQYPMDSDELYDNLNQIADKIKVGGDVTPTAKQYNSPDYKLTSSDKEKSGGFGEMF